MWSTPVSDRPITSYSVYRDGSSIANLTNTTTQYADSDQINVTDVHTYSVVASSCAGDNTSNVVSSVSIGGEYYLLSERGNLLLLYVYSIVLAPSSPLVTLSQTDISCSNTLISWSTPSSDRSITSYSVYRDDTLIYTGPNTTNQSTDNTQLSISTVYEYSVVAVSCAGTSTVGVKSVNIGGEIIFTQFTILSEQYSYFCQVTLSPLHLSVMTYQMVVFSLAG